MQRWEKSGKASLIEEKGEKGAIPKDPTSEQ